MSSEDRVRRARLIAELQRQRAICDAAEAAIAFASAVIADQKAARKRNREKQRACRARIKAAKAQLRALGRAERNA